MEVLVIIVIIILGGFAINALFKLGYTFIY